MKKKLFCLLLSLATCACLAFGAAGCEKNNADSGQTTEQGGNSQNSGSQSGTQSSADAPVYLGMSIASSSERYFLPFGGAISKDARDNDDHDDDDDDDDDHDDHDDDDDRPHNGNGGTQSGSGNSNDKWSPDADGGVYYSRPNRDIDITIHFENPKQFEIMSFTLNEKKYAVNMFEKGSDLENIILKVSVGDFDGMTEYTIDAIKYIDGSEIKDVRINGDKTVKLYREYEIDYHDDYDANLPEEYTILSDTITLSEPSRTGYTFEGWFEDKAYTKKIESIEKGSKGDRDIYAKWTVIDYTITYHLDGGTNGENPESYTVEDKIVLQKAEKAGYAFEGWFEDEAFTKKAESFENATGDKQLYAKWKLFGYQINYHLNGGENSSENPLSYTVDDAVAFKQAEKRGYTFLGWFEDEACTEKIEGIEKGSKGDRDIYAKWEIVTYKIEYVLDGGTNDDNPTSYTVEDIVELKNAEKKDNYFLGWYKDEEHKELVTELENMTGDLKLFAWWVEGTEGLSFEEVEGGYAVSDYEGESETVVIPEKYFGGLPVVAIGYEVFVDCKSITSVTIPSGVTSIENSAFHECKALESIEIPDGVTKIGEAAFAFCTSLREVIIPKGVTAIENHTFYCCNALEKITIPDRITSIGDSAFSECFALEDVVIPNGVTSIGDEAFRYCEKLDSIIIPDSVTEIGDRAFYICPSLKSILIGKGVKRIGENVFYSTALTEIRYNGTAEEWGKIKLNKNWAKDSSITKIICADGTVIKLDEE